MHDCEAHRAGFADTASPPEAGTATRYEVEMKAKGSKRCPNMTPCSQGLEGCPPSVRARSRRRGADGFVVRICDVKPATTRISHYGRAARRKSFFVATHQAWMPDDRHDDVLGLATCVTKKSVIPASMMRPSVQ